MPFLGVLCDRSADELVWEQRFSEFELAFLSNHRVGTVKLLPGTCYIEMARAMVRQQHGEACFALTNVQFQTILFLDEAELRGPPTVRVRLHPSRQEVSIMSRFDDGAWDEHALMELELRPAAPAEPLAVEAVQARCPQTVDGATFYAHTGNDYHGEFRALQRAWGRGDGSELLGVVEYSHAERRQAHLRSCAWLDACSHKLIWWRQHGGRPFYVPSVRSYAVLKPEVAANRTLWSHFAADPGTHAGELRYFDERREPVVRIEGWSFGFFEAGWLEGRRAQRHMYEVHWEPAAAPKARRSPRPVVLVSSPAVSTARYPTTDSQAAATVAAVAFDGSSQRLSTLPSLQAALCLVQATDTARPLWLTSCAARGAEAGAALWGLARCARLEALSLPLCCADGEWGPSLWRAMAEAEADEPELDVRRGTVRVPRLATAPPPRSGPMRLQLRGRGSLNQLSVQPQHAFDAPLLPRHAELRVHAVGLNFRDVLNVLGEYPGDPGPPGLDCAGVVTEVGTGVAHLGPGVAALGFGGWHGAGAVGSLASLTRGPAA